MNNNKTIQQLRFSLQKNPVQPERHNFIHNCEVRETQTIGIYSWKSHSKLIRIIIMLECISSEEAKQFVRHPGVHQIPDVLYANRNPLRGIPVQESDSVRCCIKYEPMKNEAFRQSAQCEHDRLM